MIARLLGATGLVALSAGAGPTNVTPAAHHVEIVAMDYAYRVPAHIASGPTEFSLVNRGKVLHEFIIVLLKQGVTPEAFMDRAHRKAGVQPMVDSSIGALFARPGRRASSRISANLLPGRDYVIRCTFQDSVGAPRHLDMGMYAVMRPEGRATSAEARAVDTIFADDYAFRHPVTLAAGHHTIVLANGGKMRHELNIFLLKTRVSLRELVATDTSGGDVGSKLDEGLGVLFADPGGSSGGMIEATLLAGREYSLICDLSDRTDAPTHVTLGMFASISVPMSRPKR